MIFEILYEKFNEDLERFARSIAGNEQEAEDLLQETYLKALAHIHTLNQLADYQQKAWLFKVLKNLRFDRFRKQKYEVFMDNHDEPEFNPNDYSAVEIKDLLGKLPQRLREVIHSRYWLGLTSKQIGEQLGIADATVRDRLRTAIRILREQIN